MELKNFFAQDDQGNILGGAICYLYQRGTESLVSELQASNGLALDNPFAADQHGLIQFAVPNGIYDLRVVKGSRDYRLQVQCNDVTETAEAAEGAARALEEKLADPSSGAGIVKYKNHGLAGIAGIESVDVNKKLTETVSLYDFRAKGGGLDDSVPLHDALSWVYGGDNRTLLLPHGGTFRVPEKLNIPITGMVRNCHLTGYGATLLFEAAGGIKVYPTGTGLLSELTVKGIRTGGGVKAFEFVADDDLNFIYNLVVEDLDVNGFSESGLVMGGNVFESSIRDYSASSLNATGYCIHLRNVGDGIVSSVDVWGGNTRGGKHGLFVENPVSDVGIYGGTYLQALNEGVRIDNAIGTTVFRAHVEHNWRSAGSLAAGGAGLHMSGRGTIIGVVGQNSATTFQQYVVSAFANDITVMGGGAGGTYTKYGRYQQSPDGTLVLIGEAASNYDVVKDTQLFPTQIASMIKSKRVAKTENLRDFFSVVSIDLNRGNFIRVKEMTGPVQIANPTNRAGVTGEEIMVELVQDATGGRTVNWGVDFAEGMTAINGGAYRSNRWTFVWSGGKWKQSTFASTF
ncbi:hypothetical protein [Pseudomonas sp. DSV-1]|uniref:hypothetical protein n=1 Tax=Pseudomonas sp. DSV-1 TaxID=3112250 RepID=UPI002DB7CB71|nr:hypothetical protein [Pseudomonas sp. DSV-1]MEC4238278.1 hypothetical protein [Pseudomonas sp. DSV-1]